MLHNLAKALVCEYSKYWHKIKYGGEKRIILLKVAKLILLCKIRTYKPFR